MEAKKRARTGRYFVAFDQAPQQGEAGIVCVCGFRHGTTERVIHCATWLLGPSGRIGVVSRADDQLNSFTTREIRLFTEQGALERLCWYFRWPRTFLARDLHCASERQRKTGRPWGRPRLPPRVCHDQPSAAE